MAEKKKKTLQQRLGIPPEFQRSGRAYTWSVETTRYARDGDLRYSVTVSQHAGWTAQIYFQWVNGSAVFFVRGQKTPKLALYRLKLVFEERRENLVALGPWVGSALRW